MSIHVGRWDSEQPFLQDNWKLHSPLTVNGNTEHNYSIIIYMTVHRQKWSEISNCHVQSKLEGGIDKCATVVITILQLFDNLSLNKF